MNMDRTSLLNKLHSTDELWDFIVIGGGATGMGIALDAASRGFKTLLLEQSDFGKGTSGRSTKLVHGGVRYLKQGDVMLVTEALKERGVMLRNAPHLVRNQSFIIPAYDWWETPLYTVGLRVYDLMSGRLGFGSSRYISRDEVMHALPTLDPAGLRGGIIYHDGLFDDTRMLISLARTCDSFGGSMLNYMNVTGLIKEKNKVAGVLATDMETDKQYLIRSKVVINATGVFAGQVIKMDQPDAADMIRPSQGIHLVIDRQFLESDHAIMIPQTPDGRVLFAVPWYNRVIIGTTDTLVDAVTPEPRALEEEIDFVLDTAGRYLLKPPSRYDVLSCFAGLRPLAAPEGEGKTTKEISRSHKVMVSATGLVTIIGGKWTTYRRMAEDAVNQAIKVGGLPGRYCNTQHLPLHGYDRNTQPLSSPMAAYGLDRARLNDIKNEDQAFQGFLSEKLSIEKIQVIWAVREEMAVRLEDVLARRTRALFLDARESMSMAPEAAMLMAKELGKDKKWVEDQVAGYAELARGYILK
jgi:glycerol-3-phosphate dehydrogenase